MDGRVFGGPAIGSGGVEVALTSMQARLIGILLVHGNHAVQLSTLIDEAWSGLPPDRAEVALRMQIARIRKRLIAVVGDAGALVTEHHAYRLAIAGDRLDVNRFEVAVDSAERAREQHRDGDALCLFEKALHIACGEPLGEFVDERWASGVAQHWRDRRLTVEDARFEIADQHREAVAGGRRTGRGDGVDSVPRAQMGAADVGALSVGPSGRRVAGLPQRADGIGRRGRRRARR